MFSQVLVQSGYDLEVILSEEHIQHLLLTLFETGDIQSVSNNNSQPIPTVSVVLPPAKINTARLYEINPLYHHPYQDLFNPATAEDPEPTPPVAADEFHSFAVRIVEPIIHENLLCLELTILISVVAEGSSPYIVLRNVPLVLHLEIHLENPTNKYQLRPELVDISGDGLVTLLALGQTKEGLIDQLSATVDKPIDFNFGSDSGIEKMIVRGHVATEDHAGGVGIFVNLALKTSPTETLPDRGDTLFAKNFLPAGHDVAFAMREGLYTDLGRNILHRLASRNDDGSYSYPLPGADGHIKNISIGPATIVNTPGTQPVYTNAMRIVVHGELYIDDFPNPDFYFGITLTPVIRDGMLRWDIAHDLDIPMLWWVPALTAGLFGLLGGVLGASLAAGFMTASMLSMENYLARVYSEKVDEQMSDMSFFDAIPHRLTIATRRWDPLYATMHQVVALAEEMVVNETGMAGLFKGLKIDRQPKPVDHIVLRDKQRDDRSELSQLIYRVKDYNPNDAVFTNQLPATDRMEYTAYLAPAGIETHRIAVSMAQVEQRLNAKNLLLHTIYQPLKIDLSEDRVTYLKALSVSEIKDINTTVINGIKADIRATIENDWGAYLRDKARHELEQELGHDPSDAEIEGRYQQDLDDVLNEIAEYSKHPEYDDRIEEYTTLDLSTEEFIALQRKEILLMRAVEIVKRHNHDGTVREFYRNHPDGKIANNVRSLPSYTSEG